MKKLFIVLIVVLVIFITGCDIGREELKFNGDEGSITFNVKKDKKYKLSTDKNDLRTSREQAILIGDNFKIGIEFDDNFDYFFKGDWDKLVKARKDNKDFKKVTYSDIKGIEYFYGGFMRYNVILNIKDSKKYYLVLTVYGDKDDEKSAKKAINSEEVKDILNHISSISSKK